MFVFIHVGFGFKKGRGVVITKSEEKQANTPGFLNLFFWSGKF